MPELTRYQPPKLKLPFAWKFPLALLLLVSLVAFKGAFYRLGTSARNQTAQNPGIVQNTENSPVSGLSPSVEVKNVKTAPKPPAASMSPAPALAPASVPAVVSAPAPALTPVPAPATIYRSSGEEREDDGGGGDE